MAVGSLSKIPGFKCFSFAAFLSACFSVTTTSADSTINVTVSGLSGGAFFAVQFHVAFSSRVHGVGCLAGGPYYCALGDLDLALGRCMRFPGEINVSQLVALTERTFSTTGTIDDPINLRDDQVWLLSAENDSVVATGVVQAVHEYYASFVDSPSAQIATVLNRPGEHAFLTVNQGSPDCLFKGEPYINACGYDAAGAMLQHLLPIPGLQPPPAASPASGLDRGKLVAFDQAPFLEPGYTLDAAGFNDVGYLYAPSQCLGNNTARFFSESESGVVGGSGVVPSSSLGVNSSVCGVHVAFHGCEMTVQDIGTDFVTEAGYNSWAAANDLVVLYPQAKRTLLNPKGCFDWWGYTGPDYACKRGAQMAAVNSMVSSL